MFASLEVIRPTNAHQDTVPPHYLLDPKICPVMSVLRRQGATGRGVEDTKISINHVDLNFA